MRSLIAHPYYNQPASWNPQDDMATEEVSPTAEIFQATYVEHIGKGKSCRELHKKAQIMPTFYLSIYAFHYLRGSTSNWTTKIPKTFVFLFV
jgi:hypothetical protein